MKRILVVALLFLAASIAAYGQCTEAEKKKLEEFDRAWGDAGQRGDRAFLEKVYADDFTNVSAAGVQTKAQIIDNTVKQAERARASSQTPPKVMHDYYIIGCTPNTATITHRNVITIVTEGKEQTEYTRSVHFLENRGGRWQVVSNAGHALDDAGMLVYMEQEWNDADVKRDVAWFERNFAHDYTSISSRTGTLSNKMEDIEDAKNTKRTLESAELSEVNVRVEGNTAVVTGMNRVKGRDEKGNPFDRRVRFTDTYVKRDGRWLVWATQGTEVQK